ncbi:uncharacterized protein CTRU02_208598 [Colletotrichum truncatum]|uniref:Uncharacterized protein n=1 Tax=Colletotrichum truncatum TaxID=5467 RepID=A0ACC3YWR7_COLTU|nr:uncharacterized protein CTRU02_10353 [Colletotrichum truncatum]KAF6787557.1 hypothetical protein CTRU02_10353 [Colletotrichum truncatum]
MSYESDMSDSSRLEDDFSVIERLADAIRVEEDIKISQEDRNTIVQDLYEGPRQCQCCINWMTECPHDIDLTELEKDDEAPEEGNPIIVRRRVIPGAAGSVVSIHSIEVRHAATRKVLIDVFSPYDDIVQDIKYLSFLAPFHQFYWRWEHFERAVAEEQDEEVKKILLTLKWIVKRELAEAFAVSRELTSHGVINYKYLWTLFPPGELVYSNDEDDHRFFVVQSMSWTQVNNYNLLLTYVDWNGTNFGTSSKSQGLWNFIGTQKINSLDIFPAKYLKNFEGMRTKLTERGRKFASLAGKHYKAYHSPKGADANTELRIMVDGDHSQSRSYLFAFIGLSPENYLFRQQTSLIIQAPVDSPPPNGHIPLQNERRRRGNNRFDDWSDDEPLPHRRHPRPPPPARPMPMPMPMPPPPPGVVPLPPGAVGIPPPPPPGMRYPQTRGRPPVEVIRKRGSRRRSVSSSINGRIDDSALDYARSLLTDFHLSLCVPCVMGYDLKSKTWRSFEVDYICDIEWNTEPFESLVLPDGYKDLILAFVESQVKNKDAFDDVINGKGGGLVALLAGEPGVGKTLTAESVAEKIKAPLFKMELGEYNEDEGSDYERSRSPAARDTGARRRQGDFTSAFELAARWGAVLLIDECDTYLEQRNDKSSKRNRMVSRFLRELEYYPSLLFLTTNRERCLDPAVYSRIHLTINYPALDQPSRLKIWQTFLEKNGSNMSKSELEALSEIEVDGRRIRNIVKTSGIMANREGRPIRFDDVRKVMKITEGLELKSFYIEF